MCNQNEEKTAYIYNLLFGADYEKPHYIVYLYFKNFDRHRHLGASMQQVSSLSQKSAPISIVFPTPLSFQPALTQSLLSPSPSPIQTPPSAHCHCLFYFSLFPCIYSETKISQEQKVLGIHFKTRAENSSKTDLGHSQL